MIQLRSWRFSRVKFNPVDTGFFFLLFVLGIALLYLNRYQWFFGDEFSFETNHVQSQSLFVQFFAPHNEHWSTIPFLKEWILHSWFGYGTYLPYLLVMLISHLGLVVAVRSVSIFAGSDPLLASGVALLGGIGYFGAENILWANQFCFILPTLLGVVSLRLSFGETNRAHYGAMLCLVLAVLTGGTGLAFILPAALILLVHGRVRGFLIVTVPPSAMFVAWKLHFDVHPDYPTVGSKFEMVTSGWQYAVTVLQSSFEQLLLLPGTGSTLLLIFFLGLATVAPWKERKSIPSYLSLVSIILAIELAYSRAGLGVEQAKSTRYSYIVVFLTLPVIASCLTTLFKRASKYSFLPLATMAAVLGFVGFSHLAPVAHLEAAREATIKSEFAEAARILQEEKYFENSIPETIFAPQVTIEDTEVMSKDGAFSEIDVQPEAALTVSVNTQFQITAISDSSLKCMDVTTGNNQWLGEGSFLLTQNAGSNDFEFYDKRFGVSLTRHVVGKDLLIKSLSTNVRWKPLNLDSAVCKIN